MNLDLERVLEQPGGREDVALRPGDSLEVPEYLPTVRVAVNALDSVVVVPAKPEREPLNITALLGNVAQIVAETVAIVVIAVR